MIEAEAELLCMVVMAEDGPVMENQWVTVGFAARVPQGLRPDCLGLAGTPSPLVDNSAAKRSRTTGNVIRRCPGIQACLQAQSTAHDLKCQKMSGLPFTFYTLGFMWSTSEGEVVQRL